MIIRQEPSGSTIITPHLYASFLWADIKTTKLLLDNNFSELTPKELLILYKYGVLKENVNTNVFSFKVNVDSLPSQVLLEVTSNCDCNCYACYHHMDINQGQPTINELIKRVDKLCDLGIMLFEITGGEPLLNNDLSVILERINHHNRNFYIVTNGGLLKNYKQELFDILKESVGVAVSLDGYGDKHDEIRKRPNLFNDVLKGLERLKENKIPFYLITTLGTHNYDDVSKLINLAKKYNTKLHLRPAIKTGNALLHNLDSKNAHKSLNDFLEDANVKNGFLATKKLIPESKWYGCGIRKRISIDSFGRLYPCVMDRSRKRSDIINYSQEILVSDLEEETKYFLSKNTNCNNCEVNNDKIKCGGFCRFSYSYEN